MNNEDISLQELLLRLEKKYNEQADKAWMESHSVSLNVKREFIKDLLSTMEEMKHW